MVRRSVQATFLAVAMVMMLGASGSRFERLGHQMMCQCGCGQILAECNHVGCPVSPVMISELRDQLAAGGGDTMVLNWFAAKYGPVVLAAPIRGGFDNVAWIVPIVVFLAGTVGTGILISVWRRRSMRVAATPGTAGSFDPSVGTTSDDAALRERIRRETEYR